MNKQNIRQVSLFPVASIHSTVETSYDVIDAKPCRPFPFLVDRKDVMPAWPLVIHKQPSPVLCLSDVLSGWNFMVIHHGRSSLLLFDNCESKYETVLEINRHSVPVEACVPQWHWKPYQWSERFGRAFHVGQMKIQRAGDMGHLSQEVKWLYIGQTNVPRKCSKHRWQLKIHKTSPSANGLCSSGR